MSRYLVFAGGVLFGMLLVIVGVFTYLQLILNSSSGTGTNAAAGGKNVAGDGAVPVKSTGGAVATESRGDEPAATTPLLSKPVPLSSLPLTDTQKQLVKGMGIDYDTFMSTPEMAGCAEERLGRGRVEELLAGASPSFSELTVLTRCL